ncbi:MAG TPA: DUF6398 domain-containing protein [Streptosporangiaceae bacterium]|nr:DUF6398 domain-containing protein [Streptosporangiaceae bacterium]
MRPARTHRAGPGDLLADVRQRLASGEPLDLLAYVSSLLAAVDPRGESPFERERADGPERATLPTLLESFAEMVLPETTALLATLAELGPDELTRARARRALAARPHQLPGWLARLGETSVYGAVESTHVLGDGDSVLLGARLLGYELTAVIYIDHNLGTVVKDAFPAPSPISEVVARMRETADDPDVRFGDINLADARARVAEAIEVGAIMFPPLESETWPTSRPLTEWLVRLLPEGGVGYVRPTWSKARKNKLAKRFFGSEFGKPLDDDDRRDLLDQFLWFGTDYGPGDPLRWSPVAVEILLADWIPRKIAASPEYLSAAPPLLRAFIRFCHAERKIRPVLTDETLAAVGEQEPEYQRVIRSPRPQGPMALLAAMGMLSGQQPWEDGPSGAGQYLLDGLAEEVGGQDALDSLDGTPLPDEEFGWDEVPADVRERVGEVLAACDRCCDDLLGAEYRTACRRLLARAAPGLSDMLRKTAKPEAIAAAVCWVIGKGNQRLGQGTGELRVKDLMSYFSLSQSSVSERGYQIMHAAGIKPASTYPAIRLRSPSLLVSARRRRIIELRDRHSAAISGKRRE